MVFLFLKVQIQHCGQFYVEFTYNQEEPHVLTIGPSKPTNLDFLQEAIDELDSLLQNGFKFNGKEVRVKLRCVACDAPAKAMMKGIKLFSGYYGCDRCNQTGFWCGRITYQDTENMQLRTE